MLIKSYRLLYRFFILITGVLLWITVPLNSQNVYVFNGAGKPVPDKLASMAIAGIVNRDSAVLYLQNVAETWSYSQTDEKWKQIFTEEESVNFVEIDNVKTLIDTFRHLLQGAVLYDASQAYSNFPGQSFLWQGEFATMLAGLSNGVPVPHGMQEEWGMAIGDSITLWSYSGQNSLKIPSDLTLSSWCWNQTTENDRYLNMLEWGIENILPLCNTESFFLREINDWAVSQKMFQVNIAGNEPNSLDFYSLSNEKATLLEKLFEYFRGQNPGKLFHIYGWMEPEPLVQWLSAHGATFHESMEANLSWFHTFKVPEQLPKRASIVEARDVTLENKYYIIFIGTEGDAGNWNFGFQGGAWLSPDRGKVPLAWGFNLHFFEQFPYLAYYYNKTASKNDGFVSVVTPLGYTYADVLPAASFEWAVHTSKNRVNKFKMQVSYAYKHYNGKGVSTFRDVEISNYYDTVKMSEFYRESEIETTFLFEPKLSTQKAYDNGVVLFNHVDDNTFYGNIGDLTQKKNEIVNRLMNKKPPYFYLAGYQRLVGEDSHLSGNSDIKISELVKLKTLLENDPEIGDKIEFVTPEEFNLLLHGYLGKISIPADTATTGYDPSDINKMNQEVIFLWNNYQKKLIIEKPEKINSNNIIITDLAGRVQFAYPYNKRSVRGKEILEFNLNTLRESFYIISILTPDGPVSEKILITR